MNLQRLGMLDFALLRTSLVRGQSIDPPLSRVGLGELLYRWLTNKDVMGALAAWCVNLQNSALLVNKLLRRFHVGLSGYLRTSKSELTNGKDQGESLQFMALGFPVISTPYSYFNLSLRPDYRLVVEEFKSGKFGLIREVSKTWNGSKEDYYNRLTFSGATVQSQVLAEDVKTKFTGSLFGALGFSDGCYNECKVGADFIVQDKAKANEKTGTELLRYTYSVALGLEWIPEFQSVNNYAKRTSYRMEFGMRNMPYLVNNRKINDFGINFGAYFPVSGYSGFDTAFIFGFRGTTDTILNNGKLLSSDDRRAYQ